ncbi:hypothetical protein LTR36_004686 [Oleoguttula mirabilis]|uniref:Uncharacterized protein n=1 Tax=Oleoguttula mirabilis TaxID=1507867 RepID=A0AAV9JFW8_9PEZI|nr:hypothetical protein LTR36_004686 [Oleoguttula mirabilis]
MSSPLSVKRRRINDATNTLSKPFVSPMRSAKVTRTPLKANGSIANQPYTPSTLAHTIKAVHVPPTHSLSERHNAMSAVKVTPVRKQHAFTPSRSLKRTNPAELAAQKALTSLELQIKALRNEIDTLQQAAQISSTTTDAELEALASKWQLASQQAAEEIFGTVKERVCRMGGVAAWRESEKKKFERSHGLGDFAPEPEVEDDADCEFDSQGEELPEEEQEFRKKEKRRVRREAMDAADVGDAREEVGAAGGGDGKAKVWQEGGGDDDAFTMDMMLRSLNIELKVIGYDKIAQRWISG